MFGWCVIVLAAVVALGEGPKTAQEVDVKLFLREYNADYAEKDLATNKAYWTAANSGRQEDFDKYAAAELALKTLHSDTLRYGMILQYLKTPEKYEALDLRSLETAKLKFKENQLPGEQIKKMVDMATDIEQTFNTFRPTYDGGQVTNNDLLEGLSKEIDSGKRQAMWEALKQVGEAVGGKLIALAGVRNEAARALGFKNFWEMMVTTQEHDPVELVALFDELAIATDQPFQAMKAELDLELSRRFGLAPEKMMPWHYNNPFFQQAPPSEKVDLDIFYRDMTREEIVALGGRFFEEMGLAPADIMAASDFYEREGKDQHAFCISIDRAGDVRMLLNVKPTAEWMDTMLHETGHAVYDKFVDRGLHFNLREPAHILTTEGVAMLLGALAKNPTWLVGYAGASTQQVEELKDAILEQRRREQLIFARWTLVMFNFERALYDDPGQDLNKLWYDLVERFQMLHRPRDRSRADWAAKPHFTIAPVYYHNYLMGELFAAQLRATLGRMVGHEGPASTLDFSKHRGAFGKFFIDNVFKPGRSLRWQEFVKQCTGTSLGAGAYAAEIQQPKK